MRRREQIEQELAKAETGLREGNDGLARVCARRAVALGAQDWMERNERSEWPAGAMNQLLKIQQEEAFPPAMREAAQRLLTKVSQRDQAPVSIDPIADARLILTHLTRLT